MNGVNLLASVSTLKNQATPIIPNASPTGSASTSVGGTRFRFGIGFALILVMMAARFIRAGMLAPGLAARCMPAMIGMT